VARAVDVFTPNDVPTFSYVKRSEHNFERRLEDALSVPKMIISLSGPSKSGKTVLVRRSVGENLIHVYGATIKMGDDLWSKVLDWMDAPEQVIEKLSSTTSVEGSASAGGGIGIPWVAHGKGEAGIKAGHEGISGTESTFRRGGLGQVVREIGGSQFAVFVDDFHYIPKHAQKDIGKEIKEAAEAGVRIITASVPHRSDDVVRSNTELRGRVTNIDMTYWKETELSEIAYLGFRELNADIAPEVVRRLTREAFGSPQLMQAICLNLCFELGIRDTRTAYERVPVDETAIARALERTSTQTDFSSMTSVLQAGPRQRGMERKEFVFKDGSKGDVYRCLLLAMKADPPRLSFSYSEMLARTSSVCVGDSPVGSSVSTSLRQMDYLAKTVQEAPVIEWDEDVLDIVEPYFLFFLRSSTYLQPEATS
jgi:hypothetical protein